MKGTQDVINLSNIPCGIVIKSGSQHQSFEQFLTIVINSLADTSDDFILVLDDYQLIQNRMIHIAINFLIERMPPRIHLVIAEKREATPMMRKRVAEAESSKPVYLNSFSTNKVNRFYRPAPGLTRSFYEDLSEREHEVLQLLDAGLTNKEIARKLFITISTVKTHLNKIYAKLNVHSRTQATALARKMDLL